MDTPAVCMELHEVFDAPTEQLHASLRAVKQALPNSHGAERTRLLTLKDTILQELEERGGSDTLMTQLMPILQNSTPDNWLANAPELLSAAANAPAGLQEELRQLVAAGNRIAALRQQPQQPQQPQPGVAVQAELQPPVQPQPVTASSPAVTNQPQPAATPPGQLAQTPPAAASSPVGPSHTPPTAHTAAHESAAASTTAWTGVPSVGPEDEGIEEEPSATTQQDPDLEAEPSHGSSISSTGVVRSAGKAPPSSQTHHMTVQEMALAAFKEEQRKLHKARKVLQVTSTKANHQQLPTRAQLVAAYRGPPAAATAQPPTTSTPPAPTGNAGSSCNGTNESAQRQPSTAAVQQTNRHSTPSTGHSMEHSMLEHVASDQPSHDLLPSTHLHPPSSAHRLPSATQPPTSQSATTMQLPYPLPTDNRSTSAQHDVLDTASVLQPTHNTCDQWELTPTIAHDTHQPAHNHPIDDPSHHQQQHDPHHLSDDARPHYQQHQHQGSDDQQPVVRVVREESSSTASFDYRSDSDTEETDHQPTKRPPGQLAVTANHHAPAQAVTLQVDRWSDWDIDVDSLIGAPGSDLVVTTTTGSHGGSVVADRGGAWGGAGVSAWGQHASEDPLARDLHARRVLPRAPAHAPPAVLGPGAGLASAVVGPGRQPVRGSGGGSGGGSSEQSSPARRAPPPPPAVATRLSTVSTLAPAQSSPTALDRRNAQLPTVVLANNAPAVSNSTSPEVVHAAVEVEVGPIARQGTVTTLLKAPSLTYAAGVQAGNTGSKPEHSCGSTPGAGVSDPAAVAVLSSTATATDVTASGTAGRDSRRGSPAGGVAAGRGSPAAPMTAPPAPPAHMMYTQYFNAFHEVLSMCYNPAVGSDNGPQSAAATAPAARAPLARTPSPGSNNSNSSFVTGAEIGDKYQGLMLRIGAWLDALAVTANQPSTANNGKITVGAVKAAGDGGQGGGVLGQGKAGSLPPLPPQAGSCSANNGGAVQGGCAAWNAPGRPSTGTRAVSSGGISVRYWAVADDTLHPEVRQVVQLALGGLAGWAADPIDQITEVGKPDTCPDVDDAPMGGSTCASGDTRPTTTSSETAGNGQSNSSRSGGIFTQPRSPLAGRCNMWNLLWSWSLKVRAPLNDLLAWQRVNHFPEAKQLTRKDLLNKHMVRYQVMHGGNYRLGPLFNCLPTTYALPKELNVFMDAFARAAHGVEPRITQPKGLNLWIVKPVGLSRGRGIYLLRHLRDLQEGPGGTGTVEEPLVVQRYVTNPLLVQGYKFDLRLYLLVTSFNPLEAFLCREGFARFATQPFSLDPERLTDRLVHLTNSSVQKSACTTPGALPPFLAEAEPYGGSKMSLTRLQVLLAEQGIPWTPLWTRITDALTACLFAAQDAIPACPNAFEVFGADVLLDTNGSVWVLEVNSSPSLSLDTPLDRVVKPRMLRDAVSIVDPLPFDREALLEVLVARSTARTRSNRRQPPSGAAAVGTPPAHVPAAGTNTTNTTTAQPTVTATYMTSGTVSEERTLMCSDLQQVLGGRAPRRYGDTPAALATHGAALAQAACRNSSETDRKPPAAAAAAVLSDDQNWFTCIAPSALVDRLSRLRR